MSKKFRSPAYPAISLSDSLQRAQAFYDEDTINWSPVSVAVTHWGYSTKSSGGTKTISALKAFGLMEDRGSGAEREVKLSQEALDIIHDDREDDAEKRKLIAECAKKPKLISTLIEEFPDHSMSDRNLEFYLKKQAYNPNSVSDILKVYKDAVEHIVAAGSVKGNNDEAPDDEKPEVGDTIQWTSSGVDQFNPPKKVRSIHESGEYLFVEESESGVPVNEVNIIEKGRPNPPPPPPPRMNLPDNPGATIQNGEEIFLTSALSKDKDNPVSFRLLVKGDMGVTEIGKLIKLLEAQKMILED